MLDYINQRQKILEHHGFNDMFLAGYRDAWFQKMAGSWWSNVSYRNGYNLAQTEIGCFSAPENYDLEDIKKLDQDDQ